MSKFFVSPENISGSTITITGDDVIHIKKVLRLKIDDIVTVCDGAERDYLAEISNIGTESITLTIIEAHENKNEPPVSVVLYQGMPKADKLEYIIQKSIELGVDSIVPIMTERTVVRFDSNKDIGKKLLRWQRIANEAAKQCNRGKLPNVLEPVSFKNAIADASQKSLGIIAYEDAEQKPQRIKPVNSTISIFVGPEGGFSGEEIEIAQNYGIQTVSLGPRILRTETAGIVLVSILMSRFGDIKPFI